jgi:hypothetical protein
MGSFLSSPLFFTFLHTGIAVGGIISCLYIATKKIYYKKTFLYLFFSVSLMELFLALQSKVSFFASDGKRSIPAAMLVFSFSLLGLIRQEKKGSYRISSGFLDILMLCSIILLLSFPEKYATGFALVVYYAVLCLSFVLLFFSRKVMKNVRASFLRCLLFLGLCVPPGYFYIFGPARGLFLLVPAVLSSGIFAVACLFIFHELNRSKRNLITYVSSLAVILALCVYFSYFFNYYYVFAENSRLPARETFFLWSYISFFGVFLSLLLYEFFSRRIIVRFTRAHAEKESLLKDVPLQLNPLEKIQNIFAELAKKFEEVFHLRVNAAGQFEGEKKILFFESGGTREESVDTRHLRKETLKKVFLPSEYFFHDSYPLLRHLSALKITDEFGYIVPLHLKGEFEGFFVTQRPGIRLRFLLSHIQLLIERFRAMAGRVILNAIYLSREKEIQDKIIALQEKKKIAEDYKAKNIELQQTLEQLKNKQRQLIIAEKWSSICQVTVSLNHEINNPLTHILGTAQILLMQMKKNQAVPQEEIRNYLIKVEAQCQRIKTIIENLRKVSEPVSVSYLSGVQMLKLNT